MFSEKNNEKKKQHNLAVAIDQNFTFGIFDCHHIDSKGLNHQTHFPSKQYINIHDVTRNFSTVRFSNFACPELLLLSKYFH